MSKQLSIFDYLPSKPLSSLIPEKPPSPVKTPGVSDYELKRTLRLERLRARAARLASESEGARARASQMASIIPFGQPILVGHYSEKRDRNYRSKISRTMDKSVELWREAKEVEARIRAAEKNASISSDDPNAVDKLRTKLASLQTDRARMKAANVLLRQGGDVVTSLATLGFSESQARKLQEKDFAGRIGFPDYVMTNTGSEIRRLEKRIAELETRASAPAKTPEVVGAVRIVEEENRVRMFFPGKPSEGLRTLLKSRGFHWSPTVGAWQRHASTQAWYQAREIAAKA